jgi:hypothetical protein
MVLRLRDRARGAVVRAGFPHLPYARRVFLSGFFVCAALRCALAVGMISTGRSPMTAPHWRAAVLLMVVPSMVTLLDVHVLRERLFFRNLGMARWWVAVLAFVGAAVPETVVDALLSVR